MKLGPRILLITGLFTAFVVFIALRGYGVRKSLSEEQLQLVERTAEAKALALRAQAAFKTQVQEWKNILLRGEVPTDYELFHAQFRAQEALTRQRVEWLRDRLPKEAIAHELADAFLVSHAGLSREYNAGLQYLRQQEVRDPFAVDRLVRGIDREPTELFEQILDALDVASTSAAHDLQVAQKVTVQWTLALVVGGLAFGFGVLVWLLQRWISRPVVSATHMARIIAADEYAEPLLISSNSEVGELQRSLNQMQQSLRQSRDELIRANQELSVARDEALAASEAKSRFLANVSHELRTPLNGVVGMSSLLVDIPLASEPRELAETIQKSGKSLARLIDEILDYSKLEAERVALETLPFELEEMLEEIFTAAAVRLQGAELALGFRIAPDVPRWVEGDPVRLQQILNNLVSNAVKFTAEGEIEIRVERAAEAIDAGHLQFSVLDTGIGIAPDKREIIFEAFTQADESTTRRFGGTGLGLSISRKLVALMGGRLAMSPREPCGSIFQFDVKLGAKDGLLETAVSFQPVSPPVNTASVWLVMPAGIVRETLGARLRAWGWATVETEDFSELRDAPRVSTASGAQDGKIVICDDAVVRGLDSGQWDALVRRLPHVVVTRWVGETASLTRDGQSVAPNQVLAKPITRRGLAKVLLAFAGQSKDVAPFDASDSKQMMDGEFADPEWQHLNVLLAEDNPVNAILVRKILQGVGLSPVWVLDGVEAVEQFERNVFDVVLMDINMPNKDGLDATREIRQICLKHMRETKIIALTSNAMPQDQARGFEAGMDGYLSKPITKIGLLTELRRHFSACELGVNR